MPLTKLIKNIQYKGQILKALNLSSEETITDSINLQEDAPTIVLGPHSDKMDDSVPPFYVTLQIQDMLLHNAMLDSGASLATAPMLSLNKISLAVRRDFH